MITTLDDLSVVKLDFTIPETWLPSVEAGMTIRATSDAWVGEDFSGEVTNLETRLDPQTRSATVRARMPNPDGKLRPGMLLKVSIERGERPVLQVPESALIPIGEEHYVMRVDEASVVHRDAVRIGRRRVGAVEILDGLEAGHRVVVEGLVRVRPGSNVDVVKVR